MCQCFLNFVIKNQKLFESTHVLLFRDNSFFLRQKIIVVFQFPLLTFELHRWSFQAHFQQIEKNELQLQETECVGKNQIDHPIMTKPVKISTTPRLVKLCSMLDSSWS